MTYQTRNLGVVKTSFGPQVTPLLRRLLSRRFQHVAEELSEISNHAWAILYEFLVIAGDAVVHAATAPNATPLIIQQSAIANGVSNWATYDGGVYSMNAPFVDLLDLGYSVARRMSKILIAGFPNPIQTSTQLGLNVSQVYPQYYADATSTHSHLRISRRQQFNQAFRIHAKSMATAYLVYYINELEKISRKCVSFVVNSTFGIQAATRNAASMRLLFNLQ
jgi:hypothetical protein